MIARRVAAVVLMLAALLAALAIWPGHMRGDVPSVGREALVFEPVSIPQNAGMQRTIPQSEAVGSGGRTGASGQTSRPSAAPSQSRTLPTATFRPRVADHSPSASQRSLGNGTSTPVRMPTASTTGLASTYGPGFDGWLAVPQGPGIRVRICGNSSCIVRTSTDAGPDLASQRLGRIVDLSVRDFELVCGVTWTRGLCQVEVTR
jgi:hypothetical protein